MATKTVQKTMIHLWKTNQTFFSFTADRLFFWCLLRLLNCCLILTSGLKAFQENKNTGIITKKGSICQALQSSLSAENSFEGRVQMSNCDRISFSNNNPFNQRHQGHSHSLTAEGFQGKEVGPWWDLRGGCKQAPEPLLKGRVWEWKNTGAMKGCCGAPAELSERMGRMVKVQL